MKVFLSSASFLSTYGGPAYSVTQLALTLASAGIEIGLWAPDQSAATTHLINSNSHVHRLSGTAREALDAFGRPDILHDNGIWWSHNHRLAQLSSKRDIPRIVSTRGMLEPWALKHKRWKKAIAWCLYQQTDLKRAVCHHTTAEAESVNLRELRLGVPLRMIPNGVDAPDLDKEMASVDRADREGRMSHRTAVFMGRIYPVKGLPMLVQAWARVRPAGWVLNIVGPDEAGHRAEVEKAVEAAGLTAIVYFSGMLEGSAKAAALYDADLFILPTYSENFGMAVAEALAHELPVLTTTGAPWSILPENNCGWWVAPTIDGIADGLREATSLSPKELHAMGVNGRELVIRRFAWSGIAARFMALYQQITQGKPLAAIDAG